MRIVYGAGAVAAVSVMTVGLVQPSWNASSSDPSPVADQSNAPGNGPLAQAPDSQGSRNGGSQPAPDVQVRHVVKYIQLRPGQQAPAGAKVITPGAPTPRIVTVHSQPTNPPSQNRPPVAAPPPPARPPVQAPPPKTTTHQSGHPR